MNKYFYYGLVVASKREIFGLLKSEVNVEHDLLIHWALAQESPFKSLKWKSFLHGGFRHRPRILIRIATNVDGHVVYSFEYKLAHFGIVTTYISLEQAEIWIDFPSIMTEADRDSLFIGTIFGSFLRLKGHLCLHSSVVERNGKAMLLIGRSGAGKSTTAASLVHGYEDISLVADDVATLTKQDDVFKVMRGYPAFRLHVDAIDKLNIEKSKGDRLVYSNDAKRYIFTGTDTKNSSFPSVYELDRCFDAPLEIFGMCLLNSSANNRELELVRVTDHESVLKLTANTYANYAVLTKEMIQREFNFLLGLAADVPLYEASYNKSSDVLPLLCESLVDIFGS